MTKWFDSNKLTSNTDKCEPIDFGRGRPENTVIKDQTIDYKSNCKYLGLHIDPKLPFKDPKKTCCGKKFGKLCGLIYHMRHLEPRKCLLMCLSSFAKSIKTYCLLIDGRSTKASLEKIESNQRRNLCAMFFEKNGSMDEKLPNNKSNTIYELFIKKVVHEIFKEVRLGCLLKLLKFEEPSQFQRQTKRKSKGLFSPIIVRTMKNIKSLAISLMIVCN